jgi:signal transduction histidine kinase
VTLATALVVRNARLGTLAVTVESRGSGSVRSTAYGLAALVGAAMIVIVAVGAVVSRTVLREVRVLLDAHRAVAAGKLWSRAPVRGHDELGDLAAGFNSMAEHLEASYTTLEERGQERTAEVRRLLAERTELFAGLSHELRTPLAIVLAQADLLRRRQAGNPDSLASAEAIRVSTTRLLGFVNEVLELARSESGQLAVTNVASDVRPIVADVRPAIAPLVTAAGVKYRTRIAPRLGPVMCDPSRVRQVLLNLVGNAVKYTPAGGSVELRADSDGDDVRFSVIDTGVGIPPELGNRVFEPFFRVPGVTSFDGQASSGLGLAIAKRLVEAQGGRIGYESKSGERTVFWFTLRSVLVADATGSPYANAPNLAG